MKKIISLVLCLSLIFSAIQLPVMATNEQESSVYYVSASGSDESNGRTLETAFATIDKAQSLLPNGGTIMISGTVNFDGGEPHTGMITMKGVDNTAKIKFVRAGWFNQINDAVKLLGPTTFKNVGIPNSNTRILTNGQKLVIDRQSGGGGYVQMWVGNVTNSASCTTPEKLTVNNWPGDEWTGLDIRIGAFGDVKGRSTGDVDVVWNGGHLRRMSFEPNAVFKGNVNLTWNGGTLTSASGSVYEAVVSSSAVFEGAFQFISNNGKGNKILGSTFGNINAADGEWFMYGDTTGGKLTTTDNAGEFEVQEGFQAVATNRDTQEVYKSKDSILNVPMGTYDVTYIKVASTASGTVYVSATGSDSNDGLTSQTPFATIDKAQIYLNDVDVEEKTIIVSGEVEFDGGEPHDDMITIKGADSTAKIKFVRAGWFNQINDAVKLLGPTTFKNVGIPNSNTRILTNGQELVIDRQSGGGGYVQMWVGNVANSASCTTPEKLTVNNWPGDEWSGLDIRIGAFGDVKGRSLGTVDVVWNGGYLKRMSFEPNTVFKDNVNLTWNGGTLTSASGSAYEAVVSSSAVFEGAFQFISNNGKGNKILGSTFGNINAADGEWFMYGDKTGGMLVATDTAGTYAVTNSTYAKAVNQLDNSVYYVENGLLTVPAGTYDVTFEETTNPDGPNVPGPSDPIPSDPTPTLPEGEKMIYLDVTSKGQYEVFGQNVSLEKGKTYSISFQYEFLQGDMNLSTQLVLKDQFGSGKYDTYHGSHMDGAKGFTITKDRATGTVTYIFTHAQESGSYGVGFQFLSATKLYLGKVSMYEITDTNKVNILQTASEEKVSLKGWRSDWVEAKKTEKFEIKNGDDTKYTAILEVYDASKFGPSLPAGQKMIHLDVKSAGKDDIFGQNVELEKGKSYTISYQYKFEKGDMNVTTYLLVKAAFGSGKYDTYHGSHMDGSKGFTKTEEEATCTVYYTFTHMQESGTYGIGFQCFQPTQMYIANVTLYETNDANKTNLLPSAEESDYWLKGWRADWSIIDETEQYVLKQNNVEKYIATLKSYDASLFVPRTIEPTMIYIEATQKAESTTFGQNVKLEKGKQYTISFRYKFKEGDMNSSVYLRVKAPLRSGKYDTYYDSNAVGKQAMNVKYDKETCTATYTFTNEKESGTYCIGFQIIGATKLYLADFKVYETTDGKQRNLLPSKGYEDSLFGWSSDWQEAKIDKQFELKDKNKAVIFKAVAMTLDNNIFKPDPKLPPKMLYIENNGTYRQLLQRIKLVPGETYRFSFVVATPIALKGMVMHKGERITIFNNMNPINNPDYTQDYYEMVFEFTLPTTYAGEAIDLSNIFVGIQLPPNSMAYVYNPQLWNVKDAEKENLFVNPGFNKGLDSWILSWGAWFVAGQQGTGLTEYESEGNFKLQVMDYDTQKFITYYDDSRFDDGEWWTAESIAKEEKVGSAAIKGRFLAEDNEPISNLKVVLKSLKETYETTTRKDGTFTFEKLPAGFYQLYYVRVDDGEETLVETGFAQNVKDAYTVNVEIHATVAKTEIPMVVWFISGGSLLIAAAGVSFIIINKRKKGLLHKAEK